MDDNSSKYARNQENAFGDLSTAAAEFRLVLARTEVREDEFGRRGRVLVVVLDEELRKSAMLAREITFAAVRAHDAFVAMGWDAVLHIDAVHAPRIHVRLDP